jgi:uncharacterized membrane protein
MNLNILKLIFSSSIYSFTPLVEKIILKTLTKDIYMFIKYAIRFIILIGLNIFTNKNISFMENITKIKSVFILLIGATIISLSSQYIYFDVLKHMDISLIEPISSVVINIFSVIIGIFILKETVTLKKLLGVGIGGISIFLLTS